MAVGRTEPPTCWAVISSSSKPTSVLICTRTKFYLGILESKAEQINFEWALSSGSYLAIEPNVVQQELALVHDSGVIQVVSSESHSLLHTIQLSNIQCLSDIQPVWLAPSVLALQTSARSLQVYGTNNSSYTFDYRQNIKVDRDVDGVKVFTSQSAHFLSLVPEAMQHVFGLASADPGALLFEASQKLQQQEHTFYEFIKLIGGEKQMREAVDKCLQTAAHHFNSQVQKDILRAAKMGMMLCERYNTTPFVNIARTLRVLNTLRQFGLPLSYAELEELSMVSLINRLNALHQWPLAIQICNLMEIGLEEGVYKVLANWCLAIITQCAEKSDRGEEQVVAQKIFSRLESYPGISYADIADVAAKHNLQGLAALLLDREPNLSRQVTVLLKLKQTDKALNKAVLSQQPDLLHLVLRHLRKSHTSQEVELLLRKSPQALSLYQSYIHEEAPDKVLALYEQGDDFARQVIYHLCKARDNSSTDPFFDPTTNWTCSRRPKKL
uniref:Vacuolar protein sorting-associated protein 16 homolog n=1 Tax=Ditylenchus dipsaci TaxID=166011 RepID=A0A915DEZ6_9BILA